MRQTIQPLFALLMAGLQTPAHAGSTEIKIIREVTVEPSLVDPHSISRTPDGGYVMTGIAHQKFGWAAKSDANGKVVWRLALPKDDSIKTGDSAPDIREAAAAADGGFLLCGYAPIDNRSAVSGLLAFVNANGELRTAPKAVYPNGNKSKRVSYLRRCARWGDGFVVAGYFWGDHQGASSGLFYWLLALNSDGTTRWEKAIPAGLGGLIGLSQLIILPNHDLVVSAWRNGNDGQTEVLRVDTLGNVVGQLIFPGSSMLLNSSLPGSDLVAVSLEAGDPEHPTPSLAYISPDLKILNRTAASKAGSVVKKGFLLKDGSLLLFGSKVLRGAHTATIDTYAPDLQTKKEFQFEPFNAAYWVADAARTNEPFQYATIRRIYKPSDRSGGVVLSFVEIVK